MPMYRKPYFANAILVFHSWSCDLFGQMDVDKGLVPPISAAPLFEPWARCARAGTRTGEGGRASVDQ